MAAEGTPTASHEAPPQTVAEQTPTLPQEAPPIRARGLVKRYGEVLAVDDIDLDVGPGDVYGFLGPNGAGKTTTLRMALGLITPSEGTVELFGLDPMRVGAAALHRVAGFVEAPRFYPYLTGRKNLELLAGLDGGEAPTRIDRALETVELSSRAKHRVGGYSHGMRQRLGIAAALLRDPRLLILDEPATGLDPAGMRDMRLLIMRLSSEGITVLLSSHQLPEVQELCDRVAIVNRGRIVYEGALDALRRMAGASHTLRTSDDEAARPVAMQTRGIELLDAPHEHAGPSPRGQLRIRGSEQAIGALSLALGAAQIAILQLTPELATLEDLFFRLTEGGAE
ncbi:MAG TPA: ABC transporter ATP-binding protein [Solirubrobacteraceae bacterium]|jgi:ABC-2 type transport system ATP-binding protein